MKGGLVMFMQTDGSFDPLNHIFKTLGLQSEGHKDARAFLSRLREAKPSACLIDLCFDDAPVMLAIVKGIRNVLGPSVPIVAVVPRGDTGMGLKAKGVGATSSIEKPVDAERLVKALALFVKAREAEVVEVPPVIKWFFEKMAPIMAGLAGVLEPQISSEAQLNYFAQKLVVHSTEFIEMINILRKSEIKVDLLQGLRMYGLRNAKSLVVASKLSDLTGGTLLQWHPVTRMPTPEPGPLVRFALRAADHFGEGSRYEQVAYNSGLILDLLSVLAESAENKAMIRKFINDCYERAIKEVAKCIDAAKKVPNLALERHIITALLMREAGKAAMAIFFPEYLDLRAKLERKNISPHLQHIVEMKLFSTSHNLLGSIICQGAPGLGDAYEAVLFFDYAFLLRGARDVSDAYTLIEICHGGGSLFPEADEEALTASP